MLLIPLHRIISSNRLLFAFNEHFAIFTRLCPSCPGIIVAHTLPLTMCIQPEDAAVQVLLLGRHLLSCAWLPPSHWQLATIGIPAGRFALLRTHGSHVHPFSGA